MKDGGKLGRPRKPVGTRQIDLFKTVILKIPIEIYEKIEKKGKPSDVVLIDLLNLYKN